MASVSSSPRTVEEIFKDYSARRGGIVRALTDGTLYIRCILTRTWKINFCKYLIHCGILFSLLVFTDVDEFYGLCDPGI